MSEDQVLDVEADFVEPETPAPLASSSNGNKYLVD